jgi:hypothetical protein
MILDSLDAQTLQARSPGRPLPGEEFVETDAVAGACFSGLLAVDARPLLAGAVAALIADIPAAAVLVPFGSLDALGKAAGISTCLRVLPMAARCCLVGCFTAGCSSGRRTTRVGGGCSGLRSDLFSGWWARSPSCNGCPTGRF